MSILSIHNKYPPEIFTGDPGECDLLVGLSLLDALCSHSVRIAALVHSIMETWKVQSPEEKWKRAIAWIQSNSRAIREDLKNISLLILVGPIELPPLFIRYRFHDDTWSTKPFDRTLQDWHFLKSPSVDRSGSISRQVAIPSQLLEALNSDEPRRYTMISPGTIGLHDLYLRYKWSAQVQVSESLPSVGSS